MSKRYESWEEWLDAMRRAISMGMDLTDNPDELRELNYLDQRLMRLVRREPPPREPSEPMQQSLVEDTIEAYHGRPCEACGAPIVWTAGANGGSVPRDVLADGTLGPSHFKTCTDPGRFSKRSKR